MVAVIRNLDVMGFEFPNSGEQKMDCLLGGERRVVIALMMEAASTSETL
jgi:hypothetical protein